MMLTDRYIRLFFTPPGCFAATLPEFREGTVCVRFRFSPCLRGEIKRGVETTNSRINAYPNAYGFLTLPNKALLFSKGIV